MSGGTRSAKSVRRDPPLVTVRFRADATPPWDSGSTAWLRERFVHEFEVLEALFPGIEVVPLFEGVPESTIAELVARGERLWQDWRPARFLSMFVVRLPRRVRWSPDAQVSSDELRALLLRHLPVDRISLETKLAPLPVKDGADITSVDMPHLDPQEQGLDVEAVWSLPGGKGAGELLADVEQGWHTAHPEFSGITANVLPGGLEVVAAKPHGTMALSVAVARKDLKGVVGVAPLVPEVVLSSEMRLSGEAVTEAAIMDAIVDLTKAGRSPGGVLLLEVQKEVKEFDAAFPAGVMGPCEMKVEVFEVIQLAVANHIIVVEAAGNGSENAALMKSVDLDVLTTLLHGDSGAIVVGQSRWDGVAAGHAAIDYACTGKRIDCFGWGFLVPAASVVTATIPYTPAYTPYFGGTSSASAMIAGTVLVVQGLVRNGAAGAISYLPPMQMRALLRDRTPGINTPLGDGQTELIGVLPDLQKLATQLGLLPDLYIRDNIGDVGDPHDGMLCHSPDIIVRTTPLGMTPAAAFGEGTPGQDDDELSEPLPPGGAAEVYVRVRNRGGVDAVGARVVVYYAQSATLIQPVAWNKIGETLVDVPKNKVLTVAGPIAWNAVPAAGHYCFIATIEHASDPLFTPATFAPAAAVIPPEFRDIDGFRRFIRTENNVAWRNFNVIPVAVAESSVAPMAADVPGPDEGDADMELRVEGRLPADAILEVEMPEILAAKLSLPDGVFTRDAATETRRGKLPAAGVTILGVARLGAGTRHTLKLHVHLPASKPRRSEVALVQLHRGQVVGRVTWRFRTVAGT